MFKVACICVVCFAVQCASAGMTNEGIWIDGQALERDLRNPAKRSSVVGTLRIQRLNAVRKLVDLVGRDIDSNDIPLIEQKVAAIRVLAVLHAEEAVLVLIMNITIEPFLNDSSAIGDRYPAVAALVAMGKPASRAALDVLGKEDDAQRRDRLCEVICGVEGVPVGRFMVEYAIEQATDATTRARLGEALRTLNKNGGTALPVKQ